jgi:hypothetical protein
MNWFYATKDQTQAGPVDEATLANLISTGTITPQTLVWKQGMASWQPYAAVFMPPSQTATAPVVGAGLLQCAECGQTFPPEQLISLAGRNVCASCKPVAVQKFQEGVVSFGSPVDPEALWQKVQQRGFDFTISSVLTRTWEMWKGNFWPCLGVTILGYLILVGSGQIPFLGILAIALVQPQIMAGLYWYFVRQFRGESATINDSFAGFRRGYGQQAIYMLIFFAICLGAVIAIAIPTAFVIPLMSGGSDGGSVIGISVISIAVLIGVAAIWYFMICWILTPLLILDKGMKATAAMKLSRRVISLRFWKVMGLFLVLGLISIVGILALFIGVFLTLPLFFASVARLYEDAFSDQAR